MFMLDVPGDDLLCGKYSHSPGPMQLKIYLIKSSGMIFYIIEKGASSCNCDSDYDHLFFYDQNGHAVYFESGGLFPSKLYYENGIASLQIVFPDEYGDHKVTQI